MDYKEMVEKIADTAAEEVYDGVRFITKKIPDCAGAGKLDRRLFESAKDGVGISYPKNYADITSEELRIMREEIGAVNQRVTQGALVEDVIKFDGIKVYRYQPETQKKLPVMIYIHGGGFVGGRPEMCENLCRDIAYTAGAAVFSIEYRLSPEHKYPDGLNDCFTAVDGILAHLDDYGLDCSRVSLAGDSAGGNLALCCSIREAERGTHRIQKQILLYPAVNIGKYEPEGYCWNEEFYRYSDCEEERRIQRLLTHDVGIFDDMMVEAYAGGLDKTQNKYICPVLNKEWDRMPETVIVLGEYDYLVQEGIYLAKQMAKSGVPVAVFYYLGMCHAFGENLGVFPQAEDLMREMARIVQKC